MRTMLSAAVLGAMLAACGGEPKQGASEAPGTANRAGAAQGDDAVAAVLQSTGAPVAQLRFLLESRPEPGVPFLLRLVVSAATPIPELSVSVESATLEVADAAATLSLTEPDAAVMHEAVLTAGEEGLAEVIVRLRADAQAADTVYAIPVLIAKPAAAG